MPCDETILRLAKASTTNVDACVLGDALKREVVYRILQFGQGNQLRNLAFREFKNTFSVSPTNLRKRARAN